MLSEYKSKFLPPSSFPPSVPPSLPLSLIPPLSSFSLFLLPSVSTVYDIQSVNFTSRSNLDEISNFDNDCPKMAQYYLVKSDDILAT